jgi:hypothetical protein
VVGDAVAVGVAVVVGLVAVATVRVLVAPLVLVQDAVLVAGRLGPVGAADHRQTVRQLLAPGAVLELQEDLLAALRPAEGADDTTEPAR